MDRIRKALDLARLERAEPADITRAERVPAPVTEIAAEIRPGGAVQNPPKSIVYHRTRVFTPSPAVLEANRVVSPGSEDPAAAAFRMLRTQVLQRMDANGWRSLAVFKIGRAHV